MKESSYEILLSKLDAFIRKYYKNQLIKGAIYFLSIALGNYILVSVLEYYGRFNSGIRGFLFFLSLILILSVFFQFILKPLAGLFRIGKRINHQQAGAIIGKHFPGVQDKLINTLQLKEQIQTNSFQAELIKASIQQRTEELSPLPFSQAVDFKENKRYLKYLITPIAVLVAIFFINASIVREGAKRVVRFDKQFASEAPFRFIVLNEDLKAFQQDDIQIELRLDGNIIPSDAYLNIEGKQYKMLKSKEGHFNFTIRNVQKDFIFSFAANEFFSDEFEFDVLAKPTLSGLKARLEYPAYTRKSPEIIENSGDFNIPEGTKITWDLQVRNAFEAVMIFDSLSVPMEKGKGDNYRYSKRVTKAGKYFIGLLREEDRVMDSIPYRLLVQADAHPNIQVEEKEDSTQQRTRYFIGDISDDYGFSSLRFQYKIIKSEDPAKSGTGNSIDLPVQDGRNNDQFYYVWNIKELNLQPGDKLEYFFEVYDNDGVNGAKRSISQVKIYEIETLDEIKKKVEENTDLIKKELEDALKETRQLSKEIKKLQRKMLEKKTLNWEEEKDLQKLLDRQKELQKRIEEIKEKNKENNRNENEFSPLQEQLLNKQKELEKLFDELFPDELKQMLEEMQRLLEEQNKELLKDELEKMELNDKELDKQLDRMLEMYKRFEVEKKREEGLEKLEELAKEQEKLANETEQGKKSPEELKEKQDSLNNAFDDLQKEFEKTDSLNKDLENPLEFENPEEEMEDIGEEMEKGSESLEKEDKKEAQKKQKAAAKKMKELAEKMRKQISSKEQEQHMEDYETLRSILENLIQLSFDQENLIEELGNTRGYNPKYVEIVQRQKKITDDAKIVEDSLLALSKRSPLLRSFINTEMGKINDNLNRSLRALSNRDYNAITTQQYAMTSMNNLAVMLSEILKNMQDDMMESNGSGQSSKMKSKSKPKPGDGEKMKQMQKELGDQLKKMKEGMQQGGQQPGSKEWAKMAAQQETIRRMLQEMRNQLQQEGKGKEAGELQKTIDKMEELEKDLVNKRINPETLKRQQEIETRLLEHEKAEKEREQDEKRESREGNQNQNRLPPQLEEYLKQKEKEKELLNTMPPELRQYYKDRARDYFRELSK